MSLIPLNTANTLSTAFSPGEDVLFGNTSSKAIFTHGEYRLEISDEPNFLLGTARNLSFSTFSTLENMGVDDFNPKVFTSVQNSELKPVKSSPNSYSYFGSFYTEVANAINSILKNFPYAALAEGTGNEDTLYDYSATTNMITGEKTSKFRIKRKVVKNQGSILFNSGHTAGNNLSLMTDTDKFEIQAKSSAATESIKIKSYNFYPGDDSVSYMEFEIYGHLPVSGTTSKAPLYIRPSRKRMSEYRISQSRIEKQLLNEGLFDIPDVDDYNSDFRYKIQWPRSLDGFNPDTRGAEFESYKNNILLLAGSVDASKTDIMIKTMIPENYLDFDTDSQIYRKFVSAYAKEFDEIKQFIDNIAYAHTVNYNSEESVPNKFLVKLSNLLGWKLSSSFSEIDLFEYLADDENSDENSFAYYNIELWKRILININWLYKKKGTRDALQFLFELMGAPKSLVLFDEFVYNIEPSKSGEIGSVSNNKSNERGFINYSASNYIFQEGGKGRGNGQKYIEQWSPEFNPIKKIDNKKIDVGNPDFAGTENIMNTKEVDIGLSPSKAVESDLFEWYKHSATCESLTSTTVPTAYTISDCESVIPKNIKDMSLNEYIEHVYSSSIEPNDRKTNHQSHTTWGYPELRKVYLNYMMTTEPFPGSNRLTIQKIEPFLKLLEVNFQDYVLQMIPATTIIGQQGTSYKNTVFNRQRFVYKEGINRGSEFQVKLPPSPKDTLTPYKINTELNKNIEMCIAPIVINTKINDKLEGCLSPVSMIGVVNKNKMKSEISSWSSSVEVQLGVNP